MKSIVVCENTFAEEKDEPKASSKGQYKEKTTKNDKSASVIEEVRNHSERSEDKGDSNDEPDVKAVENGDGREVCIDVESDDHRTDESDGDGVDNRADSAIVEGMDPGTEKSGAEKSDGCGNEAEESARTAVGSDVTSDDTSAESKEKEETTADVGSEGGKDTEDKTGRLNGTTDSDGAIYLDDQPSPAEKDCTNDKEAPHSGQESPDEMVMDVDVDVDENKENEKVESGDSVDSSTEIRVGDCQTVSEPGKESDWTEQVDTCANGDLTDSAGTTTTTAEDTRPGASKSEDASSDGEVSRNETPSSEKVQGEQRPADEVREETGDGDGEEYLTMETDDDDDDDDDSEPEVMEFEVEESDTSKSDGNGVTRTDKGDTGGGEARVEPTAADDKGNEVRTTKKRHGKSAGDDDVSTKKLKLNDSIEEVEVDEGKEIKGDSRSSSPSAVAPRAQAPAAKGQDEGSDVTELKDETVDSKTELPLKSSSSKEEDGQSQGKNLPPSAKASAAAAAATSSFLASLRGTLKSLTRSDLEELIVQKLCEVITERSVVGELRRKAQALEEEQERWRTKAQNLTKQMREMEMVMKKYMSEVQKQAKDGSVVVPLRVTRSVGLQVSFMSGGSKGSRASAASESKTAQSPAQTSTPVRSAKSIPPSLPPHISMVPSNNQVRNKPAPPSQKSPVPAKSTNSNANSNNLKKPVGPPRLEHHDRSRQSVTGTTILSNRLSQSQTSGSSQRSAQGAQHHNQQQNGSKVIDLTEDDDRQTAVVVKPPAPVRVVNHTLQAQIPPNSRLAYVLPAPSPAAVTNPVATRQVLITTPVIPQPVTRPMVSMPPLLFKGGTPHPIPAAAGAAAVATPVQAPVQPNRVAFPKPLRHPAPLPQTPVFRSHRPNMKLIPPKPALKISKVQTGIVLSWNMNLGPEHAPISSYQLYAYQEGDSPPATSLWKKVGDVKALPLPMACTLTQFMSGHKYHFAVRAVDLHSRIGPFSIPGTIVLVK